MSESAQELASESILYSTRHKVRRALSDPQPKRTRGLGNDRKSEKLFKATRQKIQLPYDDFTDGPPTSQLASLSSHSIGAIIRNKICMVVPSWKELPDLEKGKEQYAVDGTSKMLRHINTIANTIYRYWK